MGIFSNLIKSNKEKEQAEFLAPQLIEKVNESIDLINSTKNPETFFFRVTFLVKCLKQLVVLEKFINFSGEKPRVALERVMSEKVTMVNSFLERYFEDVLGKAKKLKTNKAKEKRVENFYLSLEPYLFEMEEVNKEKLNDLILILEDELDLIS